VSSLFIIGRLVIQLDSWTANQRAHRQTRRLIQHFLYHFSPVSQRKILLLPELEEFRFCLFEISVSREKGVNKGHTLSLLHSK
jgi:hypothetical protein